MLFLSCSFSLAQIVRLFNKVQSAAVNLMTSINDAINTFLTVIGANGQCGIGCIFGKLKDAIAKLPEIAKK